MTFTTKYPELNPVQRKMLLKDILAIIGEDGDSKDTLTIGYNTAKAELRAALHQLFNSDEEQDHV